MSQRVTKRSWIAVWIGDPGDAASSSSGGAGGGRLLPRQAVPKLRPRVSLLEIEPASNLDDPRPSAFRALQVRERSKRRSVKRGIRRRIIGMVEQISYLGAELQPRSLGEFHRLDQ